MKNIFVHWRTTLLGFITGLIPILIGIVEKNPSQVITGLGVMVTGALSADGINIPVPLIKEVENIIVK
jgi:hypothetical protein